MDSDIELIDDDILEDCQPDSLVNDFSQVKILVHGADNAERILDDLVGEKEDRQSDHTELQQCTEDSVTDLIDIIDSPDEDLGNYVIPDQLPFREKISQTYPEGNTDRFLEKEVGSVFENDADEINDYSERDSCNYIEDESEPENEEDIQNSVSVLENRPEAPEDIVDLSYGDDVTIKEEIDDFDGTDFTDFDGVHNQIYSNDLPPEDIYHFNNKIILGSKPCHNMSKVREYEEDVLKEYLDTEVPLEDWGERLEHNPCFCKKCGILFSTPNGLDSHNMTTHSFLVAISNNKAVKSTAKPAYARKSTGSPTVTKNNVAKKSTGNSNELVSTFCNHCNMVFPNHTDLIKHLYELLPFNKQFNCNVCKIAFNTQKELVKHNAVHVKKEIPKVKREKIAKEDRNFKKKLLYEEDLKKKRPVDSKTDVIMIPISVLFQCTKCNMIFLNAYSSMQHYNSCNSDTTSKKLTTCKICKRVLRYTDLFKHKKQHELSNKFKVYKITRTLYERTLCKCLKCEVHYTDLTITPHLRNCGNIPSALCQKCNILLPKSKLEGHMLKHIKQNVKPKDFVIVEHFILNKCRKRKREPIVTPAKKIKLEKICDIKKEPVEKKFKKVIATKVKKERVIVKKEKQANSRTKLVSRLKFERDNKIKMYYCKHCERCCFQPNGRSLHVTKKCIATSRVRRSVCEECGLYFSEAAIISHSKHHEKRKFTVHDIAFYNFRTLRRTVPPIPAYPQCKNCNIKFLTPKLKRVHMCGENYKTCKVCGDKFDISAYNVHMELHKLIKSQPQKEKPEAKIMPELIKKYESLNMSWNIIYSCAKCDIVTDSYDKAVEHSQAHLINEASSKNIKCYICNLKFDETCWSKHSDLHSRMNINSKDFKILDYEPQTLLTDEWFELFDSLPEDQIRQITDKSLYGYERGVRMKVLKEGRPEFTLYCCGGCNVCFHNNDISKHLYSACKNPANFCNPCGIPFTDVNALRLHELLHLKGIKKEVFRVISFTKINVESNRTTGMFVLCKCSNCNLCVRHKSNIYRHVCRFNSRVIKKCEQCNLHFNIRLMPRHLKEHLAKPEFNRKNIRVELFDPCPTIKKEVIDDDSKPIKRKYTSNGAKTSKPAKFPKTDKPKTVKGGKPKSAKSGIAKTVKGGIPKLAKSGIAKTAKHEIETAKVYKCECGLHYTSPKTIDKHIAICSSGSNISKENCSKCGLLFPTDVLVSHLCKHHSKNTEIVVELYKRTELPGRSSENVESTSETPKSKKANSNKNSSIKSPFQNCRVKLYKCSECNIYFINQNTCYKHTYKDHQPVDAKNYIECKLCGLQFTLKSLTVHVTKHHVGGFSLNNVLVEEYQPRVGKGRPNIDIYVASEKLQSLQVTSSIEENKNEN